MLTHREWNGRCGLSGGRLLETSDVSPDDTRVDSPDTAFLGFLRVMGVVLVIFGLAVMSGLCPLLDLAAIGLPNSRSFLAEGSMMLGLPTQRQPAVLARYANTNRATEVVLAASGFLTKTSAIGEPSTKLLGSNSHDRDLDTPAGTASATTPQVTHGTSGPIFPTKCVSLYRRPGFRN